MTNQNAKYPVIARLLAVAISIFVWIPSPFDFAQGKPFRPAATFRVAGMTIS
jgi:hypothetical protein